MNVNLPTNLLRSFVAIVDAGSIVVATEKIFLTQSALSLQMKRLAEIVQAPIFRREHGALALAPAGERLVGLARKILELNDQAVASFIGDVNGPIRIGLVQDFGDEILSGVLSRYAQLNPCVELEIRIGSSVEIRERFQADLIDIAVYHTEREDEFTIAPAPMVWIGDPVLLSRDILPLACMVRPCLSRDCSIAALEGAGRPYQIVVETPNISALRAAVEAGLAVTCRSSAFLGHRVSVLELERLPLPTHFVSLMIKPCSSDAVSGLAGLIRQATEELVVASPSSDAEWVAAEIEF